MKNKIIRIVILLATIVNFNNLNAGTITGVQKATATLVSSCSVVATDLNFGNLVMEVNNYATMSINVLCSKNTAYTVGIDLGLRGTRQMKGVVSNELINYKICQVAWVGGDSCPGPYRWNSTANIALTGDGTVISTSGTGIIQTFTGYGGALVNYPVPDTYLDTSTVIITY